MWPAVKALAAFLEELHPEACGSSWRDGDKQYEEMVAILKAHAQQFHFYEAQSSPRKKIQWICENSFPVRSRKSHRLPKHFVCPDHAPALSPSPLL